MQPLLTMLLLRPYVFGFLVAFLFLAVRRWGWARTVLWLVLGYSIAWASEALSIRTGFPYGWYFYKYENLTRDILVMGVPFWDSLSYTFLIFAGYMVVKYRWPRLSPAATAIAGGAATMLLDMMIDPVSNLGDRWFLGSIYYYPTGGAHFGVPVSNYIGWFFVSWLVISIFQRVTAWNMRLAPTGPAQSVLYPAFYISIGLFNTLIAAWIDAWGIVANNGVIMAGILYILLRRKTESSVCPTKSS
jgi:putative membrane protein